MYTISRLKHTHNTKIQKCRYFPFPQESKSTAAKIISSENERICSQSTTRCDSALFGSRRFNNQWGSARTRLF